MKTILVAIDFEEKAAELLEHAIKIGKQFGSKLWLVHVVAPEPDFVGYDVGPVYIREFRARELKTERKKIDIYTQQVREAGLEAEGLLIDGITVDLLIDEAKKLKADLMVVGTHRHGFLYKLWFGDTAETLIHSHSIPTLVVPL